jgi:hypothetical protein
MQSGLCVFLCFLCSRVPFVGRAGDPARRRRLGLSLDISRVRAGRANGKGEVKWRKTRQHNVEGRLFVNCKAPT